LARRGAEAGEREFFTILDRGGSRRRVGRVWSGPAGSESEGLRSGRGHEAGGMGGLGSLGEAAWWAGLPSWRLEEAGRLGRALRGSILDRVQPAPACSFFIFSLFFSPLPYHSSANLSPSALDTSVYSPGCQAR
jgi:hypothetical protein